MKKPCIQVAPIYNPQHCVLQKMLEKHCLRKFFLSLSSFVVYVIPGRNNNSFYSFNSWVFPSAFTDIISSYNI
jgi:hypothetical protein